MTQDPPKKPWEKAAEQSPNARKPWEKAAVPEPDPAPSFQQPPLPQKSPQQVGGGGGLPTGQDMPSAPSPGPSQKDGGIAKPPSGTDRGVLFRNYWNAEGQARALNDQFRQAQENASSVEGLGGLQRKQEAEIGRLASLQVTYAKAARSSKGVFDRELDAAVKEVAAAIPMTMDREGIEYADPTKVMGAAKAVAATYGVQDPEFEKLVYDRLLAHVDISIIEKDAERRFKERAKPAMDAEQLRMQDAFKTDSIEYAKAKSFIDASVASANAGAKQDIDAVSAALKQQADAVNASLEQAGKQYEQQAAQVQKDALSGAIPPNQAQQQLDALYKAYQEQFGQSQAAIDGLNAKAASEVRVINQRYNRRFQDEQRRILEGAERRIDAAAAKFANEYGSTPDGMAMRDRLRKLQGEAWRDAAEARGKKIEAVSDARFLKQSLYGNVLGAMTARFGESVVEGLGGSFKGIASTTGDQTLYLLGEEMQRAFVLPETKSDSFSDLLDAQNFAQSTGQLVGGMLPSLAASTAAAVATGGASVPIQMLAAGAAGWGAETLDISGRARDDVYRNTGSREKADDAGWKSFVGQVQLMPAYAFEGLPFVGKALDFIPTKALRMGAAAGTEYGTQLLQEIPQSVAEQNILQGKDAYEDFWQGLSSMKESGEMNRLLVTMAPISLLGAGGQIAHKSPEQALEDAVKAYMAKADLSRYVEGAAGQWINRMVADRGSNFSSAVIASMHEGGQIDEARAAELIKLQEQVIRARDESKRIGLSKKDTDIYTALSLQMNALHAQAEMEQSPAAKAVVEKRAKEIERSLVDFANEGKRQYVEVGFADGTSLLMDRGAAMRALKDPRNIVQAAMQGDVISIDFQGDGMEGLVADFQGAVMNVSDAIEEIKQRRAAEGPVAAPAEVSAILMEAANKPPQIPLADDVDPEVRDEERDDAIAIAVNDIAASIEDGKKYGVMSGDGSVVDEQQTFDIIDLDYGRIRALAEKGRLTVGALAKTSWGRAISSADLGRIANVLNNKPELVDKVFSGINGRINSRATKPLEEVSDAGDYRIQNRPNQDNHHTNEGGQVQEAPRGLGGTATTQEGVQGEVPQGGTEGQGVAPVAAVEEVSAPTETTVVSQGVPPPIEQPTEVEDAIQVESPTGVGAYPSGEESTGGSPSSEALGQGVQGEAVAQEDGTKDEVAEVPPTPPDSEPKSTEQSGNFAERATTQKLIKAFPQYADVFTENAINYDRIPHIQSAEEAKALVEAVGIDRLANDIFGDTPMPGHLVSSVAPYIIQEYANRGDADAIALFIEKFAEKMTDAGQMISALNVTYDILANTPGGILMKVARTVEKNRQRQEEQAKKRTDKITKELGSINKAGISETLKTNKVRTKIAKVSEYQPKTPDDEPSWGAKNKLVTKKKYGEALKAMRGRLASGPITPEMITIAAFHIEAGAREFADVAARVVKTLGKKSLPYLKEAYKQAAKEFGIRPSSDEVIDNYLWEQSAKPIVAKLEKAIKAKDAKAQKEAIGELQSISKESGLWGQYKKQAADRLAMLSEQQIRKDISEDPILAEFTRGLVQNISAQVRELGEQKEQKKPKKQTSISIIADAFKNPEKYKEAWDASREKVRKGVSSAMAEMTKARESGDEARIKKAKDRLEKAQNRAEALDNYFGEFSPKPFSDAAIKSAVRDGMKSLEQKISDIATSHYSVQSSERGKLIDKLMKDAGLSEAEAKELSDAIGEEFDRLVTEKKRSLMKSMFSSKQRKKAEVKALEEKVIRMTNLGAFSNDDIVKAYGDAMGFSKLTEENIETIEGLANAIQEAPEGRPKYDAIQDLLNYEATLRGITPWEIADAVFMANILSGPWTHIKNITAAGFNVLSEYLVSSVQELAKGNPRGAVDLASHLVAGLGHGVNEALSVLKTGRSQVRNRKVEAMSVLELLDKSPSKTQRRIGWWLTPHKFVGRALGAEDTFFHEGAREMRAYKWALNKARKQRDPSMSLRQQALEIMNVSDVARQEAISVAQWELEDKIDELDLELERGVMTQKEYNKAVSLARLNYKRRIVEKMESLRPADLRNEAARFGSEATLNSKPYGAMGVVSDKIASLVRQVPTARRIIPFVNTLSNQANNTLNYTPIGALRAVSPGGSTIGWINRKTGGEVKGVEQKMDEEQLAQWKEDVLTKSIIGTTLAAAIYALAIGDDDDEEDPWFSVTGDGYGDPRKNVELQRLGWQPYSFKFGKTYVSYQTSPMMLTMGFVGNMFDAERYQKKQPQDSDYHNFATALASVPSIFASQSYLSGIEKTLSAALSPRNDDKVSDLSDFLLKSAKSQVEPSIYGEAFRIYQNLSGTANIDTRNSYFGQIVKNWPMARDMYPKQYNFMGEPVIPNITQVITVANSDPAATLSMKNNYVPVSESRATLSGMDPVTGKERLMTDKEADTYYQTRGREYAKWLRSKYTHLNKLSKKEFQEEAAREWDGAGAYAREAAGF